MTCTHGHAPPHCPVTGCTSARVPTRLGDWTAATLSAPDRPSPNPRDFDPDAVRLHRDIEALAKRDNASGDITRGRGFIGKREDDSVAEGAHSSWHDPPVANPDDHHQFPIVLSGLLMWQQGPAVNVPGAPMADAEGSAREYQRAVAMAREDRMTLAEIGTDGLNLSPQRKAREKMSRR